MRPGSERVGEGGAAHSPRAGGSGGESVIAVELARDPEDSIDRFEVRSRRRIVHGAVGDEQRLVEPTHLQRNSQIPRKPKLIG